ncbi:MAG: hypothetical protein A4E29_01125 [Methanomassiliicoccales archaeon PtaB.Bin134]|nr:MAG: hypothetical protein A4E29_01125 [Methanomassiliicoccales archaeon PtaB.Bin134]
MEAGSRIWILASTSVFLTSMAEDMRAILAFFTTFGMRGWIFSLSMTSPFMSSVSAMDPPVFASTFMLSTSTMVFPSRFSAMDLMALTAMSESISLWSPTDLPVIAVMATRFSMSSVLLSTAIFSRILTASRAASL